MITHIHGKLVEKKPTFVVIDCNGVGYHLNISVNTFGQLADSGACKLLTHFVVREDAQILYGFATDDEREMFRLLISVSGIGANTARLILSGLTPDGIANAIGSSDVDTFVKIKGLGVKSAQRVIVDLKDKVENFASDKNNFVPVRNTNQKEALSALVILGFDSKKVEKLLNKLVNELGNEVEVETLIKHALKRL